MAPGNIKGIDKKLDNKWNFVSSAVDSGCSKPRYRSIKLRSIESIKNSANVEGKNGKPNMSIFLSISIEIVDERCLTVIGKRKQECRCWREQVGNENSLHAISQIDDKYDIQNAVDRHIEDADKA